MNELQTAYILLFIVADHKSEEPSVVLFFQDDLKKLFSKINLKDIYIYEQSKIRHDKKFKTQYLLDKKCINVKQITINAGKSAKNDEYVFYGFNDRLMQDIIYVFRIIDNIPQCIERKIVAVY